MKDATQTAELIEQVFDLGARMITALDSRDFDHFGKLVEERGHNLEAIREQAASIPDPSGTAARWAAQEAGLIRAVAEAQRHMEDQIRHVERLKEAEKSYAGNPVREGMLHAGLQG